MASGLYKTSGSVSLAPTHGTHILTSTGLLSSYNAARRSLDKSVASLVYSCTVAVTPSRVNWLNGYESVFMQDEVSRLQGRSVSLHFSQNPAYYALAVSSKNERAVIKGFIFIK